MVQTVNWNTDDWSERCAAFRACLERLFEEYPSEPERVFHPYYRGEALYYARRGQLVLARHYAGEAGIPEERIDAVLTLLG